MNPYGAMMPGAPGMNPAAFKGVMPGMYPPGMEAMAAAMMAAQNTFAAMNQGGFPGMALGAYGGGTPGAGGGLGMGDMTGAAEAAGAYPAGMFGAGGMGDLSMLGAFLPGMMAGGMGGYPGMGAPGEGSVTSSLAGDVGGIGDTEGYGAAAAGGGRRSSTDGGGVGVSMAPAGMGNYQETSSSSTSLTGSTSRPRSPSSTYKSYSRGGSASPQADYKYARGGNPWGGPGMIPGAGIGIFPPGSPARPLAPYPMSPGAHAMLPPLLIPSSPGGFHVGPLMGPLPGMPPYAAVPSPVRVLQGPNGAVPYVEVGGCAYFPPASPGFRPPGIRPPRGPNTPKTALRKAGENLQLLENNPYLAQQVIGRGAGNIPAPAPPAGDPPGAAGAEGAVGGYRGVELGEANQQAGEGGCAAAGSGAGAGESGEGTGAGEQILVTCV